jgi:hypothetical protein
MSLIDIIPYELRTANKKEEVISYLNLLDINIKLKKYALTDWSKDTGVKLTKEDYDKLR